MRIGRQALVFVTWVVLIVAGAAAGVAVHRLWEFRSGLERLADRLTLDVGPESTLLYDGRNNLVSALFEEHRIAVPLDEMSPHLVNGVPVTEDRRFFDHDGIDPRRIVMAAIANQRAGEIVQGGSTITQQLVRSILLNREKSYMRKIKEAILARRLEERYGKRAIPFIFAQALESGFSPSSVLEGLDEPIPIDQGPWLPAGEHETSAVRLRDALVTSSNRAAAHLLQQVGIQRTLDLVSRFGITSELPAVPSLALGTGEVSLLELRESGVFEEFRYVGRLPEPCPLLHGEAESLYATFDEIALPPVPAMPEPPDVYVPEPTIAPSAPPAPPAPPAPVVIPAPLCRARHHRNRGRPVTDHRSEQGVKRAEF